MLVCAMYICQIYREKKFKKNCVVLLKPGIRNYFRVPVIKETNDGIMIMKNLIIGHLEYVSSIVPLEVTTKTESKINKQKLSAISALEISEKSMRKQIATINNNKNYWKRLTCQG